MFEYWKNSRKLLGMNARNLDFVRPFNRRRGMKIADQKLLCKRILTRSKLPVSALIGKIRSREELENYDWTALPAALKPNRGLAVKGFSSSMLARKTAPMPGSRPMGAS
jgi:hypothetical protein